MRTLVTGASGLIGRQLLARLDNAVVLSRRAGAVAGAADAQVWNAQKGPPPAAAWKDVEAVFHLAGEPVAEGRWTAEKKRLILDSRVVGTRNLVAGIAALQQRPRVLVAASAVGIYGDRGDEVLDESSSAGHDFLASVCEAWEREALQAEALGVRVVSLRIGIVLARGGGALARMATPFRLGVGGRIGDGTQWMPWVHIDDVVGLLLHASAQPQLHGAINAVAPEAVTNAEFTRSLGRALHRPTLVPVPRTMLRAAFGEMSEVLFASQRVLPRVATESGYAFRHPHLAEALRDVL